MPKPARDRLAQLLAGAQPQRADSAMLRAPGDILTLEVADLGAVTTPIRAAQAKRLIAVARPAQFGHRELTVCDASVRDTWELTPDQVRLGGRTWDAHLAGALEHFRDELGLPAGARLTAELHSLLVYGKGQFFLPHQDSEKHDDMVATLVVMPPSVHTGGELVIDDAGRAQTYSGSREDLVLVAFYADRRHEVRPVRSGYRVTLTFNVLLTGPSPTQPTGPVETAASHLTEHFATRISSPYGAHDPGAPTRLAFLLDHEYTQHSLARGRLKGEDAERVATLQAAAARAGCESVLALAEIKETWGAIPHETAWRRDWYDDEDEDEDEEGYEADPGDDDYELGELIDDEITLGWWVGLDGSGAETIRLPLADHEVCAAVPTVSLTPYETAYEGYMGNYGNTMDRWYRRAALVMWPRKKAFAARAEADSGWALRTILARVDAGDLDGARADARSLEPFWHRVDPALLGLALPCAAGLRDPEAARVVLAPFRLDMLTAPHAPLVAALAREYGDPWMLGVLAEWAPLDRFASPGWGPWISECLVPLAQALREHEAGAVADGIAHRVWRWLSSRVDAWVEHEHPDRRRTHLTELAEPLAAVMAAASDELGASIAQELRALGEHAHELLVPLLRAHQSPPTPPLVAVADNCRSRLTRALDRPDRAEGDWSIVWSGCGCEHCGQLAGFLGARTERTHEWPLATAGRQHVHQRIDAAGLPVRHTTRRQGRPYTLVLTKTETLFRREEEVRRQARNDLAWLVSQFGSLDSVTTPDT